MCIYILDVIKCHDGFHGDRCHLNCSQKCKTCNLTDGDCLVCKDGFYGDECIHECSQHCNTTVCDKQDGRCNCTVGYACNPCRECPPNCDDTGCNDDFHCQTCDPGFYGDFCNQNCSEHCVDNRCHRDGTCQCNVGYVGNPCEACPTNCDNTGCNEQLKCHECVSGFYEDYCNLTCSSNCINGTCNRDGSCTCKEGFGGFGCCPVNFKRDCK